MTSLKLALSCQQLAASFGNVNHKTFQTGRANYWRKVDGSVPVQSVCWLYCWAKTGMNSKTAMKQARALFDAAFPGLFVRLDSDNFHAWARAARYAADDGNGNSNLEAEFAIFLQ
jgi:hypothetical protein